MNILAFSPSTRKVWIDRRAINPAYQLMAYLVARLSWEYNIYTIDKSFSPVYSMKRYTGQKIDAVISIGAIYNLSDTTKKLSFDPNYSRHKRIFEIAEITKEVFDKYNPPHINMCVDVNKWSQELTEMFGKEPDAYITEQEMGWQTYLYHYCHAIYKNQKQFHRKEDRFFYAGGAKNRTEDFLRLTKDIDMTKLIAGGGWNDILSKEDNYWLLGYIKFPECLQICIDSKYSVVFQTKEGNEQNWITGKLFMNIGTEVIGFIDKDYDREGIYVPKDSVLRVSNGEEINDKVYTLPYSKLIKEQQKIVKPKWSYVEGTYVRPFIRKVRKLLK